MAKEHTMAGDFRLEAKPLANSAEPAYMGAF